MEVLGPAELEHDEARLAEVIVQHVVQVPLVQYEVGVAVDLRTHVRDYHWKL